MEAVLDRRLGVIEDRLLEAAAADSRLVTDAAQWVIQAGGKRFRPALTLLSAQFGPDPDSDDVITAALVVELTHVASLYHDDVMDDADKRRGALSAHQKWQNSVAILVGDFLFSRASSLVADLGPEAVRIQAATFARLVQGQIAETVGPGEGDDPLEHHLKVVADKTGSLIATSAHLGARMAGADEQVQQLLTEFGERIGTVFQLSDDIIDIISDTTGKTPGTDLREQIPTLPTLLVRRDARPEDARLLELMDSDLSSEESLAEAVALLRAHPAVDHARSEVTRRADEARALLDALPALPARDALAELCTTVVTRMS
ncbi:MAG TPA: polyprenyl synthetase family protein [Candidatus Avipropionibacterium avicola]|uniref:Polyprenyl synthetase family protein n=1 Tax=Candidatus Avipropionibacterium avicola TaxID=2840701 RepID=A0A9D1KM21_9ACTN|nr:polyprenyl synthetase family protein [Candidatus Avipropionibacterium avicola]